eukprot:m.180599 g.180599  ORF g.180599 m.180599 type:complete len:157 (+) comp18424_c1_seq5:301-771(+)
MKAVGSAGKQTLVTQPLSLQCGMLCIPVSVGLDWIRTRNFVFRDCMLRRTILGSPQQQPSNDDTIATTPHPHKARMQHLSPFAITSAADDSSPFGRSGILSPSFVGRLPSILSPYLAKDSPSTTTAFASFKQQTPRRTSPMRRQKSNMEMTLFSAR